MTPPLDIVMRSSVLLVAGLAGSWLLRRRPAALRYAVLTGTLIASAAVGPVSWLVPPWDVPLPAMEQGFGSVSVPPREPASVTAAVQSSSTSSRFPFLIVIWASGFAWMAVALFASLVRLATLSARAVPITHGRAVDMAREIGARWGTAWRRVVLCADSGHLVATWGLLRPRVLLPADACTWHDERVRAVLLHELAHVRRGDWAVLVAAEVFRAVYWFNPLAWIVCARHRREAELACDDAVLRAGVPGRRYAAHLLELAKECRQSGSHPASASPLFATSMLERRIAAMLNERIDRRPLSLRAATCVGVTAALLMGPAAVIRAGQSGPLPLVGSVYDPSGAVLPDVSLTLEDAQGFTWMAATDQGGRFEFPAVSGGHYVLEARLPGFRALRAPFELRTPADWDRAITLQLGDLSERVTVTAPRAAQDAGAGEGPQRVRVGGNVRAPRKLHDVRPVYPISMREVGREGLVPIEAVIGRDGSVVSLRVLGAHVHPDFAAAALEAVQGWIFEPTLLNGVPVEVRMTVTVAFHLTD